MLVIERRFVKTAAIVYRQSLAFLLRSQCHAIAVIFANVVRVVTPQNRLEWRLGLTASTVLVQYLGGLERMDGWVEKVWRTIDE